MTRRRCFASWIPSNRGTPSIHRCATSHPNSIDLIDSIFCSVYYNKRSIGAEVFPMTIASDVGRPASVRSFWLGVAAYLVPSFPIAFVWHLVLFEPQYHALHIYRADPIIPFGSASIIIHA